MRRATLTGRMTRVGAGSCPAAAAPCLLGGALLKGDIEQAARPCAGTACSAAWHGTQAAWRSLAGFQAELRMAAPLFSCQPCWNYPGALAVPSCANILAEWQAVAAAACIPSLLTTSRPPPFSPRRR